MNVIHLTNAFPTTETSQLSIIIVARCTLGTFETFDAGVRFEFVERNMRMDLARSTICHCVNDVCNSANNSRTIYSIPFPLPCYIARTEDGERERERPIAKYSISIAPSKCNQFQLRMLPERHNDQECCCISYENICVMTIFISCTSGTQTQILLPLAWCIASQPVTNIFVPSPFC